MQTSSAHNNELALKWLLIVLLAPFTPVMQVTFMVGTYPTAYLLLVMQSITSGPLGLFLLPQMAIYTLLLYWLASLLARYFLRGSNTMIKVVLVMLLAFNMGLGMFAPLYGFGYDKSLLDLYREVF